MIDPQTRKNQRTADRRPTCAALAGGTAALLALALLAGCSPAVGTETWCRDMKAKPKGDWSANEAADFARHCLFGPNESD